MVEQSSSTEKSDSALSRWSRRKLQAREQYPPVDEEPVDPGLTKSQAEAPQALEGECATPDFAPTTSGEDQQVEEPLLTDADMPVIESLDSSSDVSCFFNAGVSEKLRQAALRHLLRLPAFNITDGLNDYDEDYTYFEPLGDIITSDMRFHAKRKAKLADEEEAARLAEVDNEQLEAVAEGDDIAEVDDEAFSADENAAVDMDEAAPLAADNKENQQRVGGAIKGAATDDMSTDEAVASSAQGAHKASVKLADTPPDMQLRKNRL